MIISMHKKDRSTPYGAYKLSFEVKIRECNETIYSDDHTRGHFGNLCAWTG